MKPSVAGRTYDEFPPEILGLPGFFAGITSLDAGDVYHLPIEGTTTVPRCGAVLCRPYGVALPLKGGIGWRVCSPCSEAEKRPQLEIGFQPGSAAAGGEEAHG